MLRLLKKIYWFLSRNVKTFFICFIIGVKYDKTWRFEGFPKISKRSLLSKYFLNKKGGKLIIGKNFVCLNNVDSNSIGLIQPCLFNYSMEGAQIIIGDNVGISGSTINATKSITIGDNTNIGSGCLITDTDSHPIHWIARRDNIEPAPSAPINIGPNVFIGARCIILKGVTIGDGAVIGAGSVVSKNIPPRVIAAGNPVKIIRTIE